MEKTTKIALFSLGGLALATGIFFGVRALVKRTNTTKRLSSSERRELENLRSKNPDELTEQELERRNQLDGTNTPNAGETTTLGQCSFPIRVGDSCKQVAQIQLAINEKHSPGTSLSNGAEYNWACLPSAPLQHSNLTVDGDLGPATAKQLGRWYGLCESSGFLWEVCDCGEMKISEGQFNNIISGADVSDEALQAAGYSGFSGYSNFNVPGFGEKYDSPLGKFYKSKYAFVDDYPKQSCMTHSYGMGKGFGFSGPENLNQTGNSREEMRRLELERQERARQRVRDKRRQAGFDSFNGQTGTESEVQSVQEFFDDVP